MPTEEQRKARVAAYTRVSTTAQVEDGCGMEIQEREIQRFLSYKGWSVHRWYRDSAKSAKSIDRPDFKKMMDAADRGMFGILVVYRLDRFSRTLLDMLKSMSRLEKNEIKFISITENIDTSTPIGRLMLHTLGAYAEFERETIVQRRKVGIEHARKQGKHMGRPRLGYKMVNGFMVKENGTQDA